MDGRDNVEAAGIRFVENKENSRADKTFDDFLLVMRKKAFPC